MIYIDCGGDDLDILPIGESVNSILFFSRVQEDIQREL